MNANLIRTPLLLLAALVLVVGGVAVRSAPAQATVKCYFKTCMVYPDGSRICQVEEVPCPTQT